MKRPLMKVALAAASVTVIVGSLAGCSTSPAEQNLFCSRDATKKEIPGDVHAIVVASNVANAPAWALTDQIKAALTEILEAGGRVDVVSTAGDGYLCPAERLGLETFTESTNEVAKEDIVRRNRNDILKAIAAAPRTDGSDAYAALHLAADQFESIGGRQRVLLFWSSGLNDHGALDYTTGLLGSEPDEVVSYLANRGPLPTLDGVTAIAAGLGWTAPPQEPLDDRQRGNVEDTYEAILSASGAAPTMDPAPFSSDPIDTLGKTVVATPLAPEPAAPTTESCEPFEEIFDQTSALQFKGDKAEFVDAPAAKAALTPIAEWLREDPDTRRVSITGTTARALSKKYQKQLSLNRARAGEKLLIKLGVEPSQVTDVAGVGSDFDGYVDDQDPAGGLLPGPAARNRSLRLVLTQTC